MRANTVVPTGVRGSGRSGGILQLIAVDIPGNRKAPRLRSASLGVTDREQR